MGVSAFVKRIVHWGADQAAGRLALQRRANENSLAYLSAVLPGLEGVGRLADPEAFVEFLRGCLERCQFQVVEIKAASGTAGIAERRFATLVDTLREGAVAVPFEIAASFARIGDECRRNAEPALAERWAGDAGLAYAIGSSRARKGRLLWNAVRFGRCTRGLELGTAYGISALFLLESMRTNLGGGRLTTVEGFDPQYELSARTLRGRFADAVECVKGTTDEVLPALAGRNGPFDILFHDAAHSRVAYERDFRAVIDHLAPGAIVLFDDIRWEDARFHEGRAETYAGWTSVVAHQRIRHAVEIDQSVGMALVG